MQNKERTNSVKAFIINATIKLLENNALEDISVSEITTEAQVSRNSFYRNYTDKNEILKEHISNLLSQWDYDYNHTRKTNHNSELYGSFFGHMNNNSDFYLLLRERNLFHLFQEVYLEKYGPKQDQDNITAYIISFIQNGMLGWVDEWLKRGMSESAESMAELLSATEKK